MTGPTDSIRVSMADPDKSRGFTGEPGSDLEIVRSERGECHLLRLKGDLISAKTIRMLKEIVLEFLRSNQGGRVILDLHQLEFASSRAVATLVGLTRSAETGGGVLLLVNPGQSLRELIGLTGTNRHLRIFDSVDEALSILES
jgi:anti-anti-sigma factor